MVDQLPPPSVDISHLITLPVWPVKLSVPLLLPEQTEVLPLTEPPTEPVLTATEVVVLAVQPPDAVTITV